MTKTVDNHTFEMRTKSNNVGSQPLLTDLDKYMHDNFKEFAKVKPKQINQLNESQKVLIDGLGADSKVVFGAKHTDPIRDSTESCITLSGFGKKNVVKKQH